MRHASYITHLPRHSAGQPPASAGKPKPKLLDQLRQVLRSRHYSRTFRHSVHLLESGRDIFFDAVDTSQLYGCLLSDGDTKATLARRANQYCIAVESFDDAQIAGVKKALSLSEAQGLLPLPSRFLPNAVVRCEPLVLAARIDALGRLVDCKTGWVASAWQENREQSRSSGPTVSEKTSAVAVGAGEFRHSLISKGKWWQFWK